MVHDRVRKAVCGEKGVLDVQENWRSNKPCKDFPAGLIKVLPKDNVQWGKECS